MNAVVDSANKTEVNSAEGLSKRGILKTREGVVVSDKMNKTVVVVVKRRIKHATVGKYITRSRKFYAHDEAGTAKIGDVVRIAECRPLSKLKRWRVQEVLTKASM